MEAAQLAEGAVDSLRRVLAYLVKERQHLRSSAAPRVELEANRRAIVAIQMQLSRALGRQYASSETETVAASRSSGGGRVETLLESKPRRDP